MILIIAGAVILILLIVIVIKAVTSRDYTLAEEPQDKIIHVSGIYSIVRKSPREDLVKLRPSEETIKQYLANQNEDMYNIALCGSERKALLEHWKEQMDVNLREVENGDETGVAFYYYDFPQVCGACAPFISKGHFVSREEIYNYPQLIPPFHLGCTCILAAHSGKSDLKDAAAGLRPFFTDEDVPALPEWKSTVSLPKAAEVSR
ncbi:MAG: hypothetical protein LBB56_02650 [Chitinispirillales bacterium]|jgi:hypothetical protein|nr:hypothetical protein [Chitinispirillales bacterium]